MNDLLIVWWKAFSIVTVTAINVTQITGHNYAGAFCTGSILSFIWWINAKTAARSNHLYGKFAYGFGAGCGTVFGMFLGAVLLRWRNGQ